MTVTGTETANNAEIISGRQICVMREYPEENFLLIYRLIESYGDDEDGNTELAASDKCYSVNLTLIENNFAKEERLLFDISRDMGEAVEIMELLARNTVTPCAALEVMDTILAERRF